jgi:hypothetical protein
VQPERHLDRTDLRRARRDNVVACECQLKPAAKADTVHARDDRDRQQLEQFQEVDTANRRLASAALLDARAEQSDIGAGREVA